MNRRTLKARMGGWRVVFHLERLLKKENEQNNIGWNLGPNSPPGDGPSDWGRVEDGGSRGATQNKLGQANSTCHEGHSVLLINHRD